MEMNTQKILKGAVFLYKKRTRLNSPRVKSYIFDKTKRATGVFGHGLCNKTECKIDTKGKCFKLHWFVILDMRIPAHVRILEQLCPEFETLNVNVPILLCASHFSQKTLNIFLSTGAFPENFDLNPNAKKELEKEPSKRKEKTCFIQKKSIHKPSIYIRIAQHMKTAYSEFRKKGNPVWNFLALEVPFAINPREKLPTGRVKNPEETEFEDTDSDDDLPVEFAETLENVDRAIVNKHVDEQESLVCGTKNNENNFQDSDEHDTMNTEQTKQNESVETDLSEKVSDNNKEDKSVETDLSDEALETMKAEAVRNLASAVVLVIRTETEYVEMVDLSELIAEPIIEPEEAETVETDLSNHVSDNDIEAETAETPWMIGT
jgi:hypothetical protein